MPTALEAWSLNLDHQGSPRIPDFLVEGGWETLDMTMTMSSWRGVGMGSQDRLGNL